jgi:hypothetical protein
MHCTALRHTIRHYTAPHRTPHIAYCTTHYTAHTIRQALYTTHYTPHTTLHTIDHTLHTKITKYTLQNTQYTIRNYPILQCTAHSTAQHTTPHCPPRTAQYLLLCTMQHITTLPPHCTPPHTTLYTLHYTAIHCDTGQYTQQRMHVSLPTCLCRGLS